MLGELRLDGIGAATCGTTAQEIGNGDAQGLAGLNVVIAGEIRIAQQENTGPGRSQVRLVEVYGSTSQQAAKLHFQKREPGRQARVTVAPAQCNATGIRGARLDGP